MANLVQFINSKHEGTHSNLSNAENTDTVKTIVLREELSDEEKTLLENLPLFKEMKAEMGNIHDMLSLRNTITKLRDSIEYIKTIEPSLDVITNVSKVTSDIANVSTDLDSVKKVAQASVSGLLDNIARHINEITHVYGMSEAIGVLNNISYKLERLYKSIDNVDSVSGHLTEIDEVSQHLLAIEIVARYYGVLEDIQEVIPELKNLADIKQDLIDFRNNRAETKEVIKAYKEAGQIVQRTIDDAVAKLEERVKKFDPESIKKLDEEMTTLKSSITTIQSTIETKFTEIDGVVANKLTPMQEKVKELWDKLAFEVNKFTAGMTNLDAMLETLHEELDSKLNANATAVNSAKLGGLAPEEYVRQTETYDKRSYTGYIPRLKSVRDDFNPANNIQVLEAEQLKLTGILAKADSMLAGPDVSTNLQILMRNTSYNARPIHILTMKGLIDYINKYASINGYWEKVKDITKPYTLQANEAIIRLDPIIEDELVVDGELYIEGTTVDLEESQFQAGQYGFFAMKNPKGRWLFCDGREISREAYPDLFEAIGTTYGEGNGTTTFNIPDRRGYFGRCLDAGAEVDYQSDREIGSKQGDAIRNITGKMYDNHLSSSNGMEGAITCTVNGTGYNYVGNGTYFGLNTDFDASRVVPTAPENVVKNIAEYVCIRY
jgi:phage tail collar domain containing protein|nr:MAG TPA: Baseplate wedge protein [Caudoviricetes sp.]